MKWKFLVPSFWCVFSVLTNAVLCLYCRVEQKHPSEPGHSRGAGSHLGAPRPAPPPAEPQTAAGTDRPAAGRAGPAPAAEPGAPRRGANQTLCGHGGGSPRRFRRFVQWQGSQGSFKTLPEQRQEGHPHVRRLVAPCCQTSPPAASCPPVSPTNEAVWVKK